MLKHLVNLQRGCVRRIYESILVLDRCTIWRGAGGWSVDGRLFWWWLRFQCTDCGSDCSTDRGSDHLGHRYGYCHFNRQFYRHRDAKSYPGAQPDPFSLGPWQRVSGGAGGRGGVNQRRQPSRDGDRQLTRRD